MLALVQFTIKFFAKFPTFDSSFIYLPPFIDLRTQFFVNRMAVFLLY